MSLEKKTTMASHSGAAGVGRPSARVWDPANMFDMSARERKAIEERARMRAELKKQWQKKVSNPYRGVDGYLV